MEGTDLNTKLIVQQSIIYLNKLSEKITSKQPALKSYYSLKRRLYELRTKIFLPPIASNVSNICNHCFIDYTHGNNKITLKPEQKLTAFGRKVLKKHHLSQPLTKFQRIYLKKALKYNKNCNHLEITCIYCSYKNKIVMGKPTKVKLPKENENKRRRKRKKERRDKLCGLQESAVLAAKSKNTKSNKLPDFIPLVLNDKIEQNISKSGKKSKKKKEKKAEVAPKTTQKSFKAKLAIKNKNKANLNHVLNKKVEVSSSANNLKKFLQSL